MRKILSVSASEWEAVALEVFHYQYENCTIYRQYVQLIGVDPAKVTTSLQIPFLPIQFFKTHRVKSGRWRRVTSFVSSGTTGSTTSRHYVRDRSWYLDNCVRGFTQFYPDPAGLRVLALLPNYLERRGSSLVAMTDHFIRRSNDSGSQFLLDDTERLVKLLRESVDKKIPTLLLGVSFALLDLAERHPLPLDDHIIIMETGGMKGRRQELIRADLHQRLRAAFSVDTIHSEYGMTELFSQAYSQGAGRFHPTPTLRVLLREVTDPFSVSKSGSRGVLNLIDLANLDTCSFIATDDLGRVSSDGSFEVLGRMDRSDVRGCNLLVV